MDRVGNFEITVTVLEGSDDAVRELKEAVAGLFKDRAVVHLDSVMEERLLVSAGLGGGGSPTLIKYGYTFKVYLVEGE